jgi:hypothetical protein
LLALLEGAQERLELAAGRDRAGEPGELLGAGVVVAGPERLHRLPQRVLENLDAQHVALDGREHGAIGVRHAHVEPVLADDGPARVVARADVGPVPATPGEHRAAACAARQEPREQMS